MHVHRLGGQISFFIIVPKGLAETANTPAYFGSPGVMSWKRFDTIGFRSPQINPKIEKLFQVWIKNRVSHRRPTDGTRERKFSVILKTHLLSCSLYYKHILIINYDSIIVNKFGTSLTDDGRVMNYDCHTFIVQGTDC